MKAAFTDRQGVDWFSDEPAELRKIMSQDWRFQDFTNADGSHQQCWVEPVEGKKRFLLKKLPDSIRHPRQEAKRLYQVGLELKGKRLPVLPLLGWGEQKGEGYLFQAFSEHESVRSVWERLNPGAEQYQFVDAVADFMIKLLCQQVVCEAFSFESVVVNETEFTYEFVIHNWSGFEIKAPTEEGKLRMLTAVTPLLRNLQFHQMDLVFRKLASLFSFTWQELRSKLLETTGKQMERARKRLIKDSTKASDQVKAVKLDKSQWFMRKPTKYSIEMLENAIRRHVQLTKGQMDESSQLLKKDRKRSISRYKQLGATVIVKQFNSPGPWGPWAADRRSWESGIGLEAYAIEAARYEAWGRNIGSSSYIFMEDLGEYDLYHRLSDPEIALGLKHYLLEACGRLVGWLHLLGIYHRDLKVVNLMVVPTFKRHVPDLKLIDLDDISFDEQVMPRRRLKNLIQILHSLPPNLSYLEQLRILAAYRRMFGLTKDDARLILEDLIRKK